MKKVKTIFGALMIASVFLTSCGSSSIESDAKKVADLQCKAQQLMTKVSAGDMSVMTESTKLATEAASLSLEMEKKYTSDSDKAKFAEALSKAMADCKSTPTTTEAKTESTSDCDKFIKDYEVFVDSYIKILKKYKKNPTDATILTEYSDVMQKATTMQTNAANCTDAKYSTKLMEIATKMSKAATELQ